MLNKIDYITNVYWLTRTGAYLVFCSVKRMRVFDSTPPGQNTYQTSLNPAEALECYFRASLLPASLLH